MSQDNSDYQDRTYVGAKINSTAQNCDFKNGFLGFINKDMRARMDSLYPEEEVQSVVIM